jgi:hypothetical protein
MTLSLIAKLGILSFAMVAVLGAKRPVPSRKNKGNAPVEHAPPEDSEQHQGAGEPLPTDKDGVVMVPPAEDGDEYAPPDIGNQKFSEMLSASDATSGICEGKCDGY